MATYLQGVTDTIPVVNPYQPDFENIQQTMNMLQQRYNQGFSAVNNIYNQVLNTPLSDQANLLARKQFIEQSRKKLKDLSSVDLSIPENQQTAEKIFSPFWEDDLMLQDAEMTRWYNGEIQKAFATRDSQDEKVRAQYNDVAVRYLQNGLDQLQKAGRDQQLYNKLEKRRFVPFQNLESYLNEQAQKAGLKIEWTSAKGPYLISTTGGSRSIPSFETFAHNMLGNNFTEQFRVMGVVEKEERSRFIRQAQPFLTDKKVSEVIAKDVVGEISKSVTEKRKVLERDHDKIKAGIAEYENKTSLNEFQSQAYQNLLSQLDQITEQIVSVKDEENTFATDHQKLLTHISENPEHYFSDMMKQRVIKGWANARASNQQSKVEINEVWKENNNVQYKAQQLDLDRKKVELDEKRYELEKWKAENENASDKNGSKNSKNKNTPQSVEQSGKFDGFDATDVTKIGNAYQVFRDRQQQRWNFAHHQIFDVATGIGKILTNIGVSDQDSVRYMDIMKTLSESPIDKLSAEDLKHFKEIGEKIKSESGIDATSGFLNARAALLESARKTLVRKLEKGGAGLDRNDLSMMMSYTTATQALEEYTALEKQRDELFKQRIISDKKYEKFLVPGEKGTKDFVGVKEISKFFSKPVYQFLGKSFTREELAKFFVEGRLTGGREDQGHIIVDDVSYLEPPPGQPKDRPFPKWMLSGYNRANLELIELEKKYGTSKEFANIRKELDEELVPNLEEYQNETVKRGYVIRYDLNKGTADVGARLINEAALPANREGIYIDGKQSMDIELNKAITEIAGMGEDELESYVSTALIKTVGINGRPSLEIKFKPLKETDKTLIGGVKIAEFAGKTVEFDLNPLPSGETLQKIRFNPGYYIYGSLLRGKPFMSDPMLSAVGFSFEVTPDSGRNPQSALIKINQRFFEKGHYAEIPVITRDRIYFSQKNPDEIINFLYGQFERHLVTNLTLQNKYEQQNKQQLITPQQVREKYIIEKQKAETN